MNDQEHYFYPPPTDSEELLLIEEETVKFERLVLDRFIPQRTYTISTKKYETIEFDDGSVSEGENTVIEFLNRHSIDYVFLKTEFEMNPYCLKEFWLSDIFYLCHEIRRDLNIKKIAEAREKLDEIKYIYNNFSKLTSILRSYSVTKDYYKIEYSSDLLFHLCLPKFYSYCYVSSDSTQHDFEFELYLTRHLRNTLSDGHRLEFLDLLVETAKSKGKWRSVNLAVTQTQKSFEDILKNNLSSNKQVIIEGRKTYIKLFEAMQKRVKEALRSKPWLRSIKVSVEGDSTAKTVLATLDILIKEQRDFLVRLRTEEFIFLKRDLYGIDTLTTWVNNNPYVIKELILADPGGPPPDD